MIEEKFDYETMSKVIKGADLPHKGIYISGGTYPHKELMSLLTSLHKISGVPISDLLRNYGRHLFKALSKEHPQFVQASKNPVDCINTVESYIHVEVRKLYPETELPFFDVLEKTDDRIVLDYKSERKMEDFAHGMMLGCSDHYNMPIHVKYEPVPNQKQHTVRFEVRLMTPEEIAKNREQEQHAKNESIGWIGFIKRLFGTK